MRVEPFLSKYHVVKGTNANSRLIRFSFFVDDTRSCWTNRPFAARQFNTKEQADEVIEELRRRDRVRHRKLRNIQEFGVE
jgi:hypothetical protein